MMTQYTPSRKDTPDIKKSYKMSIFGASRYDTRPMYNGEYDGKN